MVVSGAFSGKRESQLVPVAHLGQIIVGGPGPLELTSVMEKARRLRDEAHNENEADTYGGGACPDHIAPVSHVVEEQREKNGCEVV